jgi:hypothetical protein
MSSGLQQLKCLSVPSLGGVSTHLEQLAELSFAHAEYQQSKRAPAFAEGPWCD